MGNPNSWMNRVKHGHSIGGRMSPEFRAWLAMVDRCERNTHPSYHRYGGRGIKVCAEWRQSFQAFYDYIGPRPSGDHSLDREDNDKGYEPGNVRWATRQEQGANRETARNLTLNGVTKTCAEWAREIGVSRAKIHQRLKMGWPVQDVLSPSTRPRTPRVTSADVEAIRGVLLNGMSVKDAAEHWGVGKTTVIRIRDRQGLYKEI